MLTLDLHTDLLQHCNVSECIYKATIMRCKETYICEAFIAVSCDHYWHGDIWLQCATSETFKTQHQKGRENRMLGMKTNLFVSSLCIEIFAKGHDVEASLAKRRPHRWRRLRLSSIDDELDGSSNCLGFAGHTTIRCVAKSLRLQLNMY